MHLISDFVIEILEAVNLDEEVINELVAKLELITTLGRVEDLMVYLCFVGQKIIDGTIE